MNDEALIQRSDEWVAARLGSLGGQKIGDAITPLVRGGTSKISQDIAYELAAERLTGVQSKRGESMKWGVDHEDEGRGEYAFRTNAEVRQIGLIRHPTIEHAHVSPDALVGEDGGLEIKCPTSATHLRWIVEDRLPPEHYYQCMWLMACCPRMKWVDFMSYDPRFPLKLQVFIKRLPRDEEVIADMEAKVRAFLARIDDYLAKAAP